MKKIIFMVSTLFISVNANATSITSPIYMPEKGNIILNTKIGYTKSTFDEVPSIATENLEESWNFEANGQLGLDEKLALNFGAQLDTKREVLNKNYSAKFTNYYLGLTTRLVDLDISKLDLIINLGEEQNLQTPFLNKNMYVEAYLKYGLGFEVYNVALSMGGKYKDKFEEPKSASTPKTLMDKTNSLSFKLENEFLLSEKASIGLDLFFNLNEETDVYLNKILSSKINSYYEVGFNVDANYALNNQGYIGLYFETYKNNIEIKEISTGFEYKDTITYNFGVKLTSGF